MGFLGLRADVRRGDDLRVLDQFRRAGRLGLEHVQRGPGDFTRFERGEQSGFVNDPAARRADDARAVLHFRELAGVQQAARLGGQRQVQGNEIGARQQFVAVHGFGHASADHLGREQGIVSQHVHAEGARPPRHFRSDAPHAENAQRLSIKFRAFEFLLEPLSLLHRRVGAGNLARQSQEQAEGQLGDRQRGGHGRVDDGHAAGFGRGQVNVVHAHAGASHDLEAGRGFEERRGHFGAPAHDERVVVRDDLGKVFRGDTRAVVHGAGTQNGLRARIQAVGDEEVVFGHGDIIREEGKCCLASSNWEVVICRMVR